MLFGHTAFIEAQFTQMQQAEKHKTDRTFSLTFIHTTQDNTWTSHKDKHMR